MPTAALVFVAAFALYTTTQGPRLLGYEPETAAVAEGLVRTGDFRFPAEGLAVPGEGIRGKDGKIVGRAGLPQELLEAPFAALGAAAATLLALRYLPRRVGK